MLRLTLRVLLAYVHNLLPGSEADEISSKLRTSPLASSTLQRIEAARGRQAELAEVATRTRLVDANQVAEYLDNVMDQDLVPQFERTCFESDLRLDEVAANHRLLATAMNQTVRVSPQLKHRIKSMTSEGAQSLDARGDSAAAIALPTESAQISTSQPVADSILTQANATQAAGLDLLDQQTNVVPEYLRERGSGVLKQVAAIAGLLLVLGGLVYFALESGGDPRQPTTVVDRDGEAGSPNASENSTGAAIVVADTAPPSVPGTIVADDAAPPIVAADAAPPIVASDSPPPGVSAAAPPSESNSVADSASPMPADATADRPAEAPAGIIGEDAGPPPPAAPGEGIAMSDTPPPSLPEATTAVTPSPQTAIAATDIAPPSPTPLTATPDDDEPLPASPTGPISWQPETKDSAASVVLASQGDRLRLVNLNETLAADEQLIVPESYRTEFRLEPGLKWIVASAVVMSSESSGQSDAAEVRLRLGRALVQATADCNTLILHVKNSRYKIVFEEPTGVAAIELKYFQQAGVPLAIADEPATDAEAANYVEPVLSIAAVAGKLTVYHATALTWSAPIELSETRMAGFVGDGEPAVQSVSSPPWWYRTSIERPIDATAAKDLAFELQSTPEAPEGANAILEIAPPRPPLAAAPAIAPPADLKSMLRDALKLRRSETAALAARTLALAGDYEPLFGRDAILNQTSSRPHRDLIISSIIQSLGIEDQRREDLVEVLEKYDPPRGPTLQRLFSLPDAIALQDQAAITPWIDALSSPFLDQRVLAIYQLIRITGRELGYQPDRVSKDAISQWKKLQQAGRIQWNQNSATPL